MDNERIENENINDDIETTEPVAEPAEEAEQPLEWSAIKRPKREVAETAEGDAEESAEGDESCDSESGEPDILKIPEPEVKVAEVEDIGPIEEFSTDTATMAKMAKKAGKEARREAKLNTPDHEDDGSVLKIKSFRQIWDKICLVLLVLSIALPVGLLVYIIMHFFL